MTTPIQPTADPGAAAPVNANPWARKPKAPAQPGQPAPASAPATPAPAATTSVAPTWSKAPAPAPAAPAAPPPPAPGYAGTAQYQASTALNDAGTAPDRVALATSTLKNLTDAGDPAYQASLRQVGQQAAKFGRIGAGQTTTQLDDLALARQKSLDTTASQLATDAAGQTLSDRLNLSNAALSQYQAFSQGDLGAGNLAVSKQNANTSATSAAAAAANAAGRLNLDTTTGLGSLDLGRNDATERAREFDASQGLSQEQADRGFFLDDRTAQAIGSLGGADYSTGGLTPGFTGAAAAPIQGGYTTAPDGTLIPAVPGAGAIAPAPAAPGAPIDPRVAQTISQLNETPAAPFQKFPSLDIA